MTEGLRRLLRLLLGQRTGAVTRVEAAGSARELALPCRGGRRPGRRRGWDPAMQASWGRRVQRAWS